VTTIANRHRHRRRKVMGFTKVPVEFFDHSAR
jgi:hypothetical protein